MRYLLSEQSASILRALGAGRGGVTFEDRRIAPPGALSAGGQWKITAAADGSGAVVVSVGPGLVAWGAGVNYANPGDVVGTLAPGSSARVVWLTAAPPIALVHDPRWPTGNAPHCSDRECDCPSKEGDPNAHGGDSGALLLVSPGWTAPAGTTDEREIGTVAVSASGGVSISQIQRDTIVVRAIVGRKDSGGDKPDETPPCGHPLNAQDDTHPFDVGNSAVGGGHPLDSPGEGGYTPECADNKNTAA